MPNITRRVRFTKRLLDTTVRPSDGTLILRDTEVPGFALRVTSGRKVFFVEKRIHGRLRKVSLGPFGPLTLDKGRAAGRDMIARLIRGEDPAQDRREITVGELAEQYLHRHAVPLKRSVRDDVSMITHHLKNWRTRRLSTITTNDVAILHSHVGQATPYLANRILALIRNMFNLARTWKVFAGENPAVGIKRFPEAARDRFVQPTELRGFFTALQQEPNVYVRSAFLLGLLTGARKGEVLTMQWAHINLDEAIWRIPVTKAGRAHMIPLPRQVVDVLRSLRRQEGNPFVFPGRRSGACLVNVSKNWRRIVLRAGLEDVRIHDLRRTLGSWLAASGASLPLIGKTLNHSQPNTTAIYARLNLDPVRIALEANAQRMLAVAPAISDIRKDVDHRAEHMEFAPGSRASQGHNSEDTAVSSSAVEKKYSNVDIMLDILSQQPLDGYKAFETIMVANRAGKIPPQWAINHVDHILEERVSGRIGSLDVAFGYSTNSPKSPPVRERLKEHALENFFLDIWRFTLLGLTIDNACGKVAGRILNERGWNTTVYRLPYDRRSLSSETIEEHERLRSKLRQDYYRWKQTRGECLKEYELPTRQYLEINRATFLAQFPSD